MGICFLQISPCLNLCRIGLDWTVVNPVCMVMSMERNVGVTRVTPEPTVTWNVPDMASARMALAANVMQYFLVSAIYLLGKSACVLIELQNIYKIWPFHT